MKTRFLYGCLYSVLVFLQGIMPLRGECAGNDSTLLEVRVSDVYTTSIKIFSESISGPVVLLDVVLSKQQPHAGIRVANKYLPGEFRILVEYVKQKDGEPVKAFSSFLMTRAHPQLLHVSPGQDGFLSFEQNDRENHIYADFLKQKDTRRKDIFLLENMLLNFSGKDKNIYSVAKKAYTDLANEYNNWLQLLEQRHRSFFVSHLFRLYTYPVFPMDAGNDVDRYTKRIKSFASGLDSRDSLLLQTSSLLSELQNVLGTAVISRIKDPQKVDSFFSGAVQAMTGRFSSGDAKLYGWLVDYLYKMAIQLDAQTSKKHLEAAALSSNCNVTDPGLLKLKRTGYLSVMPGEKAPDFTAVTSMYSLLPQSSFRLYDHVKKPYSLLVFESAECQYCIDLNGQLKQLMLSPLFNTNLDVITLGLDTAPEAVKKWNEHAAANKDRINILLDNGINHTIARQYAVRKTPTLLLISNVSKLVELVPANLEELYHTLIAATKNK